MARDLLIEPRDDGEYAFISYNSEDEKVIREYAHEISKYGINIWYDKGIKSGEDFNAVLAKEISGCKCVIMFFSSNILKKENSYVYKEYDIAKFYKKKIISVVIDEIKAEDIPFQYVSFWIDIQRFQSSLYPESTNVEKTISKIMKDIDVKKKQKDDLRANENDNDLQLILNILKNNDIEAKNITCICGPIFTRYEFEISSIVLNFLHCEEDIRRTLRRNAMITSDVTKVYIDVENKEKYYPDIRRALSCLRNEGTQKEMFIPIGVDVNNDVITTELDTHMIIAGIDDNERFSFLNSMILSLISRFSSEEVKFAIIDNSGVGLYMYNDIPYLMSPVILGLENTKKLLNNLYEEMKERFKKFEESNSRSIEEYNQLARDNSSFKQMPYIIVIINNFSMMNGIEEKTQNELEKLICMSRACGFRIVISQSNSINDISPTIKVNVIKKIMFKTRSDRLLGNGDMFYFDDKLDVRCQGFEVDFETISSMLDPIRNKNYKYEFNPCVKNEKEEEEISKNIDPSFKNICRFVVENKKCSINMVMKEFCIGYYRAFEAFKMMEELNIISEIDLNGKREVLVNKEELEPILKNM